MKYSRKIPWRFLEKLQVEISGRNYLGEVMEVFLEKKLREFLEEFLGKYQEELLRKFLGELLEEFKKNVFGEDFFLEI